MSNYALSDKIQNQLDELSEIIQNRLIDIKKNFTGKYNQNEIVDAMWYSLMAGGKRIRPLLTLEFCHMCGGSLNSALSAACALEMIHTFSLIHDDLPCMDDDDMRRGKPSCHKAYGEAMALLAGDALLNYAYELIADDKNIPCETRIKLISDLTKSVGINGMIGGQVIDTTYSGEFDEKTLLDMYSMKTGALLKTACKMGCIAAQADVQKINLAENYAEKLGLAFQIIDDILDICGDEKLLGKPIGSDAECGKVTYASLNGIEKSRTFANKLTEEALEILDEFENNELLKELTRYLLNRDY